VLAFGRASTRFRGSLTLAAKSRSGPSCLTYESARLTRGHVLGHVQVTRVDENRPKEEGEWSVRFCPGQESELFLLFSPLFSRSSGALQFLKDPSGTSLRFKVPPGTVPLR